MSEYLARAELFLRTFEIEFKVTHVDAKCPGYCDDPKHIHGDRHRVQFKKRDGRALSFFFWNSYNDMRAGKLPNAYDVLACCSSDFHCPDTFAEFCSEFGYEADSRKALATFRAALAHSRKLQAFFSGPEATTLSEIN